MGLKALKIRKTVPHGGGLFLSGITIFFFKIVDNYKEKIISYLYVKFI